MITNELKFVTTVLSLGTARNTGAEADLDRTKDEGTVAAGRTVGRLVTADEVNEDIVPERGRQNERQSFMNFEVTINQRSGKSLFVIKNYAFY